MKELNWKQWLIQADQYEKAGTAKDGVSSRLSPEIVYNLFSMSLESYSMAILDYHGTLADNHTFTDLVEAIERVTTLEPELKRRILELEKCQQICSFDDFVVAQVDSIMNREFQNVIQIFGNWARSLCCSAAA